MRQRSRAVMALVAVTVLVTSACTGGVPAPSSVPPSSGETTSPSPTAVPVASPSRAPSPTAQASPGRPSVLGASGSGTFGAGTYSTAFDPPVVFTLAELTIVGTDGTIAYESIGEVNVNESGWVDIGFGFDKPKRHEHGTWSADFYITRIDKVFDPGHPAKLIDPPKDLATWIAKLPGMTLTAPPKTIQIGGLDATQLDVVGSTDIAIGPIPGVADPPAFGFGPHYPERIDVVSVDGHEVLVAVGTDDNVDHFQRAVAALQPIIDSIVWQ